MKFIGKNFSKRLFQTARRKEPKSAPFVEHPVHILLSAKAEKNEMVQQITVNTYHSLVIYQLHFPRVVVLSCYTKGATTLSEHLVHDLLLLKS